MEARIKQDTDMNMTLCEKPLFRKEFQPIIERLCRI